MTDVSRARWAPAAVGALTLLAVALRLPGLGSRSLWLDEAWLANLALAPSWPAFWDEVLGRTPGSLRTAPVPPLFALALRCLALLVGRSAAGLRALPFLASVACVPLAYLVGRRLAGRAAGLVAAGCLAAYPVSVAYGQELKPYSTDVLTVLALLLAAAAVAEHPGRARGWAVLGLLAALAPGVSYPAALVLPGLALGLLATCRRARPLALWVGTHAVAVGAATIWYLAIIAAQRARPPVAAYWEAGFAPSEAGAVGAWVLARVPELAAYAVGLPGWVVLAGVIAGYLAGPRRLALTAGTVLATVIAAAVLRVYPLAVGRTSLFLLPFVYLPLGALVAWLAAPRADAGVRRTWCRVGLAVVALGLAWPARGSVGRDPGLVREESAPLIRWLAAERQPEDRIYVYAGAVPAFLFYAPSEGTEPQGDPRIRLGGSHRDDPGAYAVELRPLLVPGERVWLLFSHVAVTRAGGSERDVILAETRIHGREIAVRETTGASLHLFEVARAPGSVRRLHLDASDLEHPERLRELLDRERTDPARR